MVDPKLELLKHVPILDGLNEDQLNAIAAVGQKVFFEADHTMITAGETGDTAYLVLSGKATCLVPDHGEVSSKDIWPGALVAELAMLVDAEHAFTVTATERVRALALQRDALRTVLEADPEIAQHLADKLLARLQSLATDLRKIDAKLAEMENAA